MSAAAAAGQAPMRAVSTRGRSLVRTVLRDYVPAIALIAALIGVWELWVQLGDTRPYILPAPSRIWEAFLQTRGTLPGHTRTTATEAVLGLGLAALAGAVIAVILASAPLARRVVYPILVLSQTIPMIVLAPLLIVWFGFGMTPKVIVVALIGFFPIVVSTTDGLLAADPEMRALVRSMGGSRWNVLRVVRIPSALPAFFAGLKVAAAYAVMGAVIAEWVGARSGLGLFITRAQTSFRPDRVFVAVFVVALLSIALFALVHLAARLATPWLYTTPREESE